MSDKKESKPFLREDYEDEFPILSPEPTKKNPSKKTPKPSPSMKPSPEGSFEDVQLSDVEARADADAEKLAKEVEDLAEKGDQKAALAKELEDLREAVEFARHEMETLKMAKSSLDTDVQLKQSQAKLVEERVRELRFQDEDQVGEEPGCL